MATYFLNVLDRIPKLIEQYQIEKAKLERDLPTLRQIVSGEWKKEDELKQLKSELATWERKIQLALAPPSERPSNEAAAEENTHNVVKEHIIIPSPKLPATETYKGFKI